MIDVEPLFSDEELEHPTPMAPTPPRIDGETPSARADTSTQERDESRPPGAHGEGRAYRRGPGMIGRVAAPREERRFDKTALHYNVHSRTISHADYIAHCEKYDYVYRTLGRAETILDVGCGTDLPLLQGIAVNMTRGTDMRRLGGRYVGVDLNRLRSTTIPYATLLGETNIIEDRDRIPYFGEFTTVVCLEVIEHMNVDDGRLLLETMRDAMSPGGRIVLSTPVYDGKHLARNHIHEYYVDELRELIESVGLVVKRRLGTFTTEPTLKRWLKEHRPDWLALYEEAREFHSPGYMSGVIAPMVPDIARNNVWVLAKGDE